MTIFSATQRRNVGTIHVSIKKQCRNYVATLCWAKNSRCESPRVTSPLDLLVDFQKRC